MIKLIVITSLFCIGFKIATQDDMIFSFIGKFFYRIQRKIEQEKLPIWFYNIIDPIYMCIYCMSSFYSIVFYSIFEVYTLRSAYELPIIIICVCGLNGVLHNILNM